MWRERNKQKYAVCFILHPPSHHHHPFPTPNIPVEKEHRDPPRLEKHQMTICVGDLITFGFLFASYAPFRALTWLLLPPVPPLVCFGPQPLRGRRGQLLTHGNGERFCLEGTLLPDQEGSAGSRDNNKPPQRGSNSCRTNTSSSTRRISNAGFDIYTCSMWHAEV